MTKQPYTCDCIQRLNAERWQKIIEDAERKIASAQKQIEESRAAMKRQDELLEKSGGTQ